MIFENETDFEAALINMLTTRHGWSSDVLAYRSEKDLIRNWADILFSNNRAIDKLNDYPLTEGEMQQILDQISALGTPLRLNGFINGKTVSIKRDNPDDKEHFGKEVSLKIYDRQEIAAMSSTYQISRQPLFDTKDELAPDRRGDFTLLINGMPVIHVELKRSGESITQATNQIEKYAAEGVFTGLYSLVQVFVAMTPDEAVYFANPGPEGRFNPDYYFHWEDFNNEVKNDWAYIAERLLSIPMAHELIGYYTVADGTDDVLKVLRSYQYYAVNKISDAVARHKWDIKDQLGGYVWHTTGSGKTLTSFKAAQLIASSETADKVIFLIDRIELGTQSADDYRNYDMSESIIQETADTDELSSKLMDGGSDSTLIVTSIQKMSRIKEYCEAHNSLDVLSAIQDKRIVFIVDECHRSSFGEMMREIKDDFPYALFFGFSGTPIQVENKKKGNTTADVFGNEIHRYTMADGIRDGNVLGFDLYKTPTFKPKEEREKVALYKANASSVEEALADPKKRKKYYKYMNEVPMAGYETEDGNRVWGIEDYLIANGQYRTEEHTSMVVSDILDNWMVTSHGYKFHGIFATSSIAEACEYYDLIRSAAPELKVTALFDPSLDNDEGVVDKEKFLLRIMKEYNARYDQTFKVSSWGRMKKDIQNRLAHKVLKYENVIQAFSRTNRLLDEEKRSGIIKYYRAPYTMERNIDEAVKVYSGDRVPGLFVVKLDKNIEAMNFVYGQIKDIFVNAGICDFESLPGERTDRKKFVKLFNEFNDYLEAAKVQGFSWDKETYLIKREGEADREVKINIDETTYYRLLQRYKELTGKGGRVKDDDTPYDLKGYITNLDMREINAEEMDAKYDKYLKSLDSGDKEAVQFASEELHKTFASLPKEEQRYANMILHDIDTGDIRIDPGKTIREYINEYMKTDLDKQVDEVIEAFGVDKAQLKNMIELNLDERSIDEFGRYKSLKATMDMKRVSAYYKGINGEELPL